MRETDDRVALQEQKGSTQNQSDANQPTKGKTIMSKVPEFHVK